MSKGQHALKYVYVELINTEGSNFDVVRGLFSGFKSKKEGTDGTEPDEFFLLYREKAGATSTAKAQPVTSLYNTKYYDIMHIEMLKNDVKELIFMTKEEEDQEKAMKILKSILKNMVEDKRMYKNDKGIIDVGTYVTIPPDRVNGGESTKSSTSTKTSTRSSVARGACGYSANRGYNDYSGYQKPEPEMTMLKRSKGKKPTKAALEAMWAKLDEITEGVFKPELPELQGDDEEPDATEDDNKADASMGQYMT